MQKTIFKTAFIIFISLKSISLFGQHNPAMANLVLEVSTITTKNYTEVKNALAAIDGVVLVAYCEESRIFLINYDVDKISAPEQIGKVVEQLDPSYKTKVKTNITFAEIMASCAQFPLSVVGSGSAK